MTWQGKGGSGEGKVTAGPCRGWGWPAPLVPCAATGASVRVAKNTAEASNRFLSVIVSAFSYLGIKQD